MKLQLFSPGKDIPPQIHPLFSDLPSCGFPSPAQDYVTADLDLQYPPSERHLLSARKRRQHVRRQPVQRRSACRRQC